MTRISSAISLLILWMLPMNASAFWFGPQGAQWSGQCLTPSAAELVDLESERVASEPDEGCADEDSTDDSSSNACFEGAEHPISTLPTLIAETFAERLTTHVVLEAARLTATAAPPLPSPREASVEDPVLPGVPLVHLDIPSPRSAPNACSVYPEECETAPRVPNLSFEGSVTPALRASSDYGYPPAEDRALHRRGPPNPGTAAAEGVRQRVERPPEVA